MKAVALTGVIGSGKSSVAAALVARGANLIDADLIVRRLQHPGSVVFEAMRQRWGAAVVADDGTLNRRAVAQIVFSDAAELAALEKIVHPPLYLEIENQRQNYARSVASDALVIFDLPLLVGADGASIAGRFGKFSGIIVVDVPCELAVQRLVESRGFREAEAWARITSQASREARLAVADWVIDNSADLETLTRNINRTWEWIKSLPNV